MLNKHTAYLLCPVNFLLVLPSVLGHMHITVPGFVVTPYVLLCFCIYGVLTYKTFRQVPVGVFFKLNVLNLAISLGINQVLNMTLEHWYWAFYALTSAQHFIALWVILLVWQCLIRFFAWIART